MCDLLSKLKSILKEYLRRTLRLPPSIEGMEVATYDLCKVDQGIIVLVI